MHYFIDGYNLLFRFPREGDNLTKQRDLLIHQLKKIIFFLDLDVTLVFDAIYQKRESNRTNLHKMEIVFTSEGETADDFILSAIKRSEHPRQITVVTSDARLAWKARRKGTHTETVEQFVKWVMQRFNKKLHTLKQSRAQPSPQTPTPSFPHKPLLPNSSQSIPPPTKASAEECYDYYLQMFQDEYSKNDRKEKFKKVNTEKKFSLSTKKSKSRPQKSKASTQDPNAPLLEFDRLLDIFEKKISENNEGSYDWED